jgi:hypothetical protein
MESRIRIGIEMGSRIRIGIEMESRIRIADPQHCIEVKFNIVFSFGSGRVSDLLGRLPRPVLAPAALSAPPFTPSSCISIFSRQVDTHLKPVYL